MRGRSYSYSPSPRRGGRYSTRYRRSPSPRGRRRDLATSLLVRNLRLDCRTEDLRREFDEFGPLKDVYLPRDYHTGCSYTPLSASDFLVILCMEPRGFGFVQFVDPDDAADAKYHMDGRNFLGRELTVVFAEENRKKPAEMRAKDSVRGRSYDRRSLSRHLSHYERSYSRSPGLHSRGGRFSRSISPSERSYRGRSYSRSPHYSRRYRERSYSRSPSPNSGYRGRSYSRSPYGGRSKYRGRSYSRSPYRRSPSSVRGRSVSPEDY